MRVAIVVLIGVALASWVAPTSQARRVDLLSYQQLLDRSDLVAIATPTSRTADTAEERVFPDINDTGWKWA